MLEKIKAAIRDIEDFPSEGITFKDISPVLQDPDLFKHTIDLMAEKYLDNKIDIIVAIDARGFIFGSALAYKLGCGMTMLRKKGKLPYKTNGISYDLEYGSNEMEIHTDAVKPNDRVLLVDDVLATGGTAEAAIDLIKKIDGNITALCCMMELTFLNGKERLGEIPLHVLFQFD